MSTIAFHNIAMHGHINPTLPVVAELVRRGHTVIYHTTPAFRGRDRGGRRDGAPLRGWRPGAAGSADTARASWRISRASPCACFPLCLPTMRQRPTRPDRPRRACPWGAIAAHELGVPAASSFTTFAFNRHGPQPHLWLARRCCSRRLAHPRRLRELPAQSRRELQPPLRRRVAAAAGPGKHPPTAQPGLHLT